MGRYKLILFDFDGTLVDTVADIAHYANEVLGDYGFAARHDVVSVKNAIGWGVHELFKTLEPDLEKAPETLEMAVGEFKRRYQEKPVLQTKLFESVRGMLVGPLAGVKKAIVTNKPQDITEKILKQLELDQYFEMTIGMHAGFEPKPDPRSTLHVMEALEAKAGETVFVGDSRIDAETALAARVDFVWMSYGYDAQKPPTTLTTMSHASRWVELTV